MLTAKQFAFASKVALENQGLTDAYRAVYNTSKCKPETVNNAAWALANKPAIAARIAAIRGEDPAAISARTGYTPELIERWADLFMDAGAARVEGRDVVTSYEQRDRFLALVAHEFRTPIAIIVRNEDQRSDAYERVTRYYVGQLAYLAGRLAAMPEGDTTVLDNSCLMFVSNMWSGSQHDSRKLPVLLVGGLGGTLKTGRVLDFLGRKDDERKLCSLYLSLMDKMGVRLERFGDATGRLREV